MKGKGQGKNIKRILVMKGSLVKPLKGFGDVVRVGGGCGVGGAGAADGVGVVGVVGGGSVSGVVSVVSVVLVLC